MTIQRITPQWITLLQPDEVFVFGSNLQGLHAGGAAKFISLAKQHPNKTFLVTEIGCGIAGFSGGQIAPLLKKAMTVDNIYLPEKFWNILG